MNVIKCQNGHFYDSDSYPECPHCTRQKPQQKESPDTGTLKKQEKRQRRTILSGITGKKTAVTEPELSDNKPVTATENYFCPPTEVLIQSSTAADMFIPGDEIIPEAGVQPSSEISFADVPGEPVNPQSRQTAVSGATFGDMSEVCEMPCSEETAASSAPPSCEADINSKKETEGSPQPEGFDPVTGWLVCISGKGAGRAYGLRCGRNSVLAAGTVSCSPADKALNSEASLYISFDSLNSGFYAEPGNSRELAYIGDECLISAKRLFGGEIIRINDGEYIVYALETGAFRWDRSAERGYFT